MDVQPTISSRNFNKLFWARQHNNFDLNCDFIFNDKTGEIDAGYLVSPEFEGAPGKTHGGILAALMDEGQGCLCYHLGHFVMTNTLCLTYRKAVPVNVPVRIRCWITAARRKNLYTRGTIELPEGEILVSATARWYVFPLKILMAKYRMGEYPEKDWEQMMRIMAANRHRSKGIRLKYRKSSQ